MRRRRSDPDVQSEDTRDYPHSGTARQHPYGPTSGYPEPERDGSGRGWMAAFFVLLALVVGAGLVWGFLLRDDDAGEVEIVPQAVDFGDQDLGKRSPVVPITIDNETSQPLRISSVAIEGEDAGDFQLADETTCSAERELGDGASCTIGVSFRPRAREERQAQLVVRVAGRDAPLRVSLRGTGVGEATVVLDTTRLDLGRVLIGNSRTRTVTLTNAGNAPLAIEEILVDGADADAFRVARATDCPIGGRLRAGESCTIAVTFRPAEGGGHTAELVVVHDAEGSPTGIELRGEGRGQAELVLDPGSLDFGQTEVGTAGDVRTVTVANGGTAPLVVARIGLAGPASEDFAIEDSSTCSEAVELEPGESCAVDLTFAPGEAGARTAALEVETRGGLAARVDLSGTGLEQPAATETAP